MTPNLLPRPFQPAQDFPAYLDLLNATSAVGDITTEQEQRDYAEMLTIKLDTDRFVTEHPENSSIIAVCDIWQIAQNPSRKFALVGLAWLYQQGCKHISFTAWGESEATLEVFKTLGFRVNHFERGYQPILDKEYGGPG